eukprot:CAMPEP_0171649030 /NCGR_PEP_ID=MMETSP0990-20121206/36507_1 /TAXON_ID=483369 /ORGANISM="non described non described, Strain CCMP2098" /LENGTH=47 /DNA_ID= /DNA_START= /DNA_END= /DNA_ORIENTATION=
MKKGVAPPVLLAWFAVHCRTSIRQQAHHLGVNIMNRHGERGCAIGRP